MVIIFRALWVVQPQKLMKMQKRGKKYQYMQASLCFIGQVVSTRPRQQVQHLSDSKSSVLVTFLHKFDQENFTFKELGTPLYEKLNISAHSSLQKEYWFDKMIIPTCQKGPNAQ